jgi:ribosomal protein S18 acetylase RimI-like enzyme
MTSRTDTSQFCIVRVRAKEDLSIITKLFTAYTTWLNIDLTFQDFANELASLPGKYAPPTGEILLVKRTSDNESLGCIALRPLPLQANTGHDQTCEVKRLYVLPSARGMGVGRALVAECLSIARELGYREAKLDTLPRMQTAIKTYESFGFVDCEKYYETPLEGTKFMKCDLTRVEDKEH